MTNKWIPHHSHDYYSLMDGLGSCKANAKRCKELGYTSCSATNHGSISGAIEWFEECQKIDIKPIIGIEFYVSRQDSTIQDKSNRDLFHQVVLAKNKNSWPKLVKLVSQSNHPDNFYYKPRISLDNFQQLNGDFISFSGHPGSELANILFTSKDAYSCKTKEEVYKYVKSDAIEQCSALALKMQDYFGNGNFYIEIQIIDKIRMPCQLVIADILREVSKKTGIPKVATADSHYPEKKDAVDQRVILCSSLKTTMRKVRQGIDDGEFGLSCFFDSEQYHIPSPEEMCELHKGFEDELDNSLLIDSMCENYKLGGKPKLPKFDCPNGMSNLEYLKELCRQGWKRKISGKVSNTKPYEDRVKHEFGVIEEANLPGYFLIIQDIIQFAKKKKWLTGVGRGSAAGCLISYLSDITGVDPIKYDLIFERFYNSGRNTKDNIEYPDIDCDFPIEHRKEVIDYVAQKYGRDKVCNIATFGKLQGSAAIKEVLRIHEVCGVDEQNRITKGMPDKAAIADKLEESGETSILRWTLINEPDLLSDYCRIEDNGELSGDYAQYFAQAIRIEGVYKTQGKHASGIVISDEPISDYCPVTYDGDDVIAAMDMNSLKKLGAVKCDILGTAVLDKLMLVNKLLKDGKI